MLPQCTTVESIWRSRSLSRRPMRFSQFAARLAIGRPYSLIGIFDVPCIAGLSDDGVVFRTLWRHNMKRPYMHTIDMVALVSLVALGLTTAAQAQTAKD